MKKDEIKKQAKKIIKKSAFHIVEQAKAYAEKKMTKKRLF